ncbi:MAG: hypothetical protein Fur0016_16720 [Anaerolineales bacterium]
MRTIRRLYFFTVVFISVEVVLWGLIHLLRATFSTGLILPEAETLAQALALILVGVPIFLLHWGWAQRTVRMDGEEHAATLRALFLYGILLATLIPVVQNLLALLNRSLITLAGLESYRALLGGSQGWVDNLIAIFFNLVAAAYFYRITQIDWLTLLNVDNFRDVRRLYRYIWVLYGLLMLIFGAQQVIRFLFYVPTAILGESGREIFLNGLALILLGAPVWLWAWQVCQQALDEPQETGSLLRLGVLYLLSLAGVVTVLSSAGVLVDVLLRLALGQAFPLAELLSRLGGPVSIGVPLGVVWAYYGTWLGCEISSVESPGRRAGLNRFYFYILSLIGLVTAFIGLALLFSFLVETLVSQSVLWGETLRERLSAALATLLVGLPLWILTWRPMQAEALANDECGDNARRSVVRRSYLYLVIFALVIGGMVSAIGLFYNLLYAWLGEATQNFTRDVLNALQLLVLFTVFLAYHWLVLRRDSGSKADALTTLQEQFPVLVFEQAGSGFALQMQAAIQEAAPKLPTMALPLEEGLPEGAEAVQAVILPSSLAFNPPEALRLWLKEYSGHKIIVPVETPRWYWPGGFPRNGVSAAAHIVRQLAEGQELRPSAGTSTLQVVAYVFAVLFGIQLLCILLGLGISLAAGW